MFEKYVKTASCTRTPMPLSEISAELSWASVEGTMTLCTGSSTCVFYIPGIVVAAQYADHARASVQISINCLSEADDGVRAKLPGCNDPSASVIQGNLTSFR